MAKPKIYLKDRENKDGSKTAYIQFKLNKKRYREYLSIHVDPEKWDKEKQRIKGRDQLTRKHNLIIELALGKASRILADYALMDGYELTPEIFSREFNSEADRGDFLGFWEAEMEMLYQRRVFGKAVWVAENRTIRRLREYQNQILFSDINRRWLEGLDAWLANQLREEGYDGTRQRDKTLLQIRKYLKRAETEGKNFTDPFQGFTWPKYETEVVYLTDKELKKVVCLFRDIDLLKTRMEAYAKAQEMRPFDVARFTNQRSISNIRDHINAFLFQCFTGMRFSDLIEIKHSNIRDDMLIFTPQKTSRSSGLTVYFPMTPMIWELITLPAPGPLLRTISNQKYNKQLKVIAWLAGVEKNITSHVGRHTFGTRMVAGGVSLVSLKELMGVTSLRTVMIYAHSGLEQQERELLRAQKGFLKKD